MSKQLSEMTLQELWELFPIILTEHQDYWADWFIEEKENLEQILPPSILLHHIGSTSIKGIWAKPIVDILIEADLSEFAQIKDLLLNHDYLCMHQEVNRIDFNKGYTPDGFTMKVFHLHLRTFGDNDELYFRDYLNTNPECAKAYEELKLSLWKPFEHNRDGYTQAKSEFIQEHTHRAKKGNYHV